MTTHKKIPHINQQQRNTINTEIERTQIQLNNQIEYNKYTNRRHTNTRATQHIKEHEHIQNKHINKETQ